MNQIAMLGRNLVAGFRLAVFLRVTRLGFRIDLAQLLLLFVVSSLLDLSADWLRYGPDGQISWYGAGAEFFGAGMLLLSAAVLALAFRKLALAIAIPVLALAAFVVVQIVHALVSTPAVGDRIEAWRDLIDLAILGWTFAVLARVVAVALAPRSKGVWLGAIAGGLLLGAPLLFAPALTPSLAWWNGSAAVAAIDGRYPNPASEPVLAAQRTLLDDALDALDDERSGQTDLYFVAFAGDARDDAWRADVVAAQKTMDDRWDTKDRSIVLANSPASLLEIPMATVTNLRETLKEIASAMNSSEDIVMIYLAGPPEPGGGLAVAMPPIELAPLTPSTLRSLLDEAQIRWRIIVVSACRSGSFVDALQSPDTLVIAAAADASGNCAKDATGNDLGAALFGDPKAGSETLLKSIEAARDKAGSRLEVGSAIAEKLRDLERGRTTRHMGETI